MSIFILETTGKCPRCESRIGVLLNQKSGKGECPKCSQILPTDFYIRTYFRTLTKNHKPLLKLIINPILRKLQFWTRTPYVITSVCDFIGTDDDFYIYEFLNYTIKRMRYFKKDEL